jgi:hypothetical protein
MSAWTLHSLSACLATMRRSTRPRRVPRAVVWLQGVNDVVLGGKRLPRSAGLALPTNDDRPGEQFTLPANVPIAEALVEDAGFTHTLRMSLPSRNDSPVSDHSFSGGVVMATETIVSTQACEECRGIAPTQQEPSFAVFARRDYQSARSDTHRTGLNPLDVARAQLECPGARQPCSGSPVQTPVPSPDDARSDGARPSPSRDESAGEVHLDIADPAA